MIVYQIGKVFIYKNCKRYTYVRNGKQIIKGYCKCMHI